MCDMCCVHITWWPHRMPCAKTCTALKNDSNALDLSPSSPAVCVIAPGLSCIQWSHASGGRGRCRRTAATLAFCCTASLGPKLHPGAPCTTYCTYSCALHDAVHIPPGIILPARLVLGGTCVLGSHKLYLTSISEYISTIAYKLRPAPVPHRHLFLALA